jgi:S1-C subfamily serine protease
MDLPSDQTGLVIQRVQDNSPAAEAGLLGGYLPLIINNAVILAGGDLIVAIEGIELTETEDLFTTLDDFAPGDEVSLDLLRDGEQLQISVTLGESAH